MEVRGKRVIRKKKFRIRFRIGPKIWDDVDRGSSFFYPNSPGKRDSERTIQDGPKVITHCAPPMDSSRTVFCSFFKKY